MGDLFRRGKRVLTRIYFCGVTKPASRFFSFKSTITGLSMFVFRTVPNFWWVSDTLKMGGYSWRTVLMEPLCSGPAWCRTPRCSSATVVLWKILRSGKRVCINFRVVVRTRSPYGIWTIPRGTWPLFRLVDRTAPKEITPACVSVPITISSSKAQQPATYESSKWKTGWSNRWFAQSKIYQASGVWSTSPTPTQAKANTAVSWIICWCRGVFRGALRVWLGRRRRTLLIRTKFSWIVELIR